MCGNEPCRHERDYTTAQAMKSYVAASALAGDAAIARDAALAERDEALAARTALAARLLGLCEDAEDRHDWVRCADLRAMLGNS
jgi:hypothetical protein